jgi:hypothetical protein
MKLIRPLADEDLDAIDMHDPKNYHLINTMGARRGRKNAAVERLKELKTEYSNSLLNGAVFILSVGSEAEAFNEVASTEGNCLSAKAEDIFEDLAGRVHPSLYSGKSTNSNLFDVVGRHLEDKAGELGMTEYPQLMFKDKYSRQIDTQADFAQLLKEAVTEQVGGEIVGITAVRGLTDAAIARNHTQSVTPILLTTKDQKFAVELIKDLERLTPRVYLVVAGEAPKQLISAKGAIALTEVNSKTVKNALKQIKTSLNK